MPKSYHHLTDEKRLQICTLFKSGLNNNAIARQLNVDKSTISRERNRNKGMRGYRFKQAVNKAKKRKSTGNTRRTAMTPFVIDYVHKKMTKEQWSPEQISGRLLKDHKKFVSHETIYRYIRKDRRNGGTLYKYLRCRGKKYRQRKNTTPRVIIKNRRDIKERPLVVEQKLRFGDLEMDTIIGSKQRGYVMTIIDRKTSYCWMAKTISKTAEEVTAAIISVLLPCKGFLHTITVDNGKEFAGHQAIEVALGVTVYFATPYRSCERGLGEHLNKLIRGYFPKNTDFSKIALDQVIHVQQSLNARPRKLLRYKNPNEALQQEFFNLSVALRN
jgi:IS30 family transposase